jgi:hypothetical protein
VPTPASKELDLLALPAEHRLLQQYLHPDTGLAPQTVQPPPEPVFRKFEQVKPAA